jgi:galactokinase
VPFHLNPDLSDLAAEATRGLQDHFSAKSDFTAAAPGRVNLIGEHIDYCGGLVLPLAIHRYVVICATLNGSSQARIHSATTKETATIDLSSPVEVGEIPWANYLRGVLRGFQNRGHHLPGFDAFIVSSIPHGAGLSSSAALTCALATLLEGLLDTVLPTREKAKLCQQAEHDFAQVPCGIMDPFTCAYAQADHLIYIDCQTEEIERIPFGDPELTFLIANTMVRHQLSDGAYASRRREAEEGLRLLGKNQWQDVTRSEVEERWEELGDPINRRALHIVNEIFRTTLAVSAIHRNSIESLSSLMSASHHSLSDLFEVSCSELDLMVQLARNIGPAGGVLGSRMTGGGFGGSTVTLCEIDKLPDIAASLSRDYKKATGITPQLFASRPAQGAQLIR